MHDIVPLINVPGILHVAILHIMINEFIHYSLDQDAVILCLSHFARRGTLCVRDWW